MHSGSCGSACEQESKEMCNLNEEFDESSHNRGCKRKLFAYDFGELHSPPKRMSPFLNTPKERKEERKKILKLSIQKLKEIENAELCLRRSLLIQNTVRQLQRELRLDKQSKWRNNKKTRTDCRCNFPTNYTNNLMYDDPVFLDVNENISDDMTDTLMKNLEEKIGGRLSFTAGGDDDASNQRICVTPVPGDENDRTDAQFSVTDGKPLKLIDDSEKQLDSDNDNSMPKSGYENSNISDKRHAYNKTEDEEKMTHKLYPNKFDVVANMDIHVSDGISNDNHISVSMDSRNDIEPVLGSDLSVTVSHSSSMNKSCIPKIRNNHETLNGNLLDNHIDTTLHPHLSTADNNRTFKEEIQSGLIEDIKNSKENSCFTDVFPEAKQEITTDETFNCSLKMHSVLANG